MTRIPLNCKIGQRDEQRAQVNDKVFRRLAALSTIICWSVEMHQGGRMPKDVRRALKFASGDEKKGTR